MRKALIGLGTVGLVMIALYTMQSERATTHRERATQELNRDIAELKGETAKTKADAQKYQARAKEATDKLKGLEADEATQKAKQKDFNKDLDAALKNMENEDGKKK